MMVWSQLNPPFHKIQLGEYIGVFMTLGFDTTAVGGINGTTYDPTTLHATTNFEMNEALVRSGGATAGVQSFYELTGIKQLINVISVAPSSSNLATGGAGKFTGSCRIVASGAPVSFFFITTVGAGNAGGGTDPLTAVDGTTEIDNSAGALAPFLFRLLVIGR